MQETSDPDHLYDLKYKIDTAQVVRESELEGLSKYYFTKKTALTEKDHGRLNAFIDPAVDRYKHLDGEEMQDDFEHAFTSFIRLYVFLTQIMPFHDADLEKLYAYGRFLLKKLPKKSSGGILNLQVIYRTNWRWSITACKRCRITLHLCWRTNRRRNAEH